MSDDIAEGLVVDPRFTWCTLSYFKIRYLDELEPLATWPIFINGNQRIPLKVSFTALDESGNQVLLNEPYLISCLSLVSYAGDDAPPLYVNQGASQGWEAHLLQGDYLYRPDVISAVGDAARMSESEDRPLPLGYEQQIRLQCREGCIQQLRKLTLHKQDLRAQAQDAGEGGQRLLRDIAAIETDIQALTHDLERLNTLIEAVPPPALGEEIVETKDGELRTVQTFTLYVSTTSANPRTLAARLYNGMLGVEVVTNAADVQGDLGYGVGGRFNSAVTLKPYRLTLPLEAYKKEEVDVTSALFNNYISCVWQSTVIEFQSITFEGSVDWSISRHSGKFSYWEWAFTVCGQPGSSYAGKNLQPYQKNGSRNNWRDLEPYVPGSISRPIAGQAIIAERLGTDHWQFCWEKDGSSAEYPSKWLVLTDVYGNVHRLRAHFDQTFQFLNISDRDYVVEPPVTWRALSHFKIRYMDELEPLATWPIFNNGNQRIPLKISFTAVDENGQQVLLNETEVRNSLSLVGYAGDGAPPLYVDRDEVNGWRAFQVQGDYLYRPGVISAVGDGARVSEPEDCPLPLEFEQQIRWQLREGCIQQLQQLALRKQDLLAQTQGAGEGEQEVRQAIASIETDIQGLTHDLERVNASIAAVPPPALGEEVVETKDGELRTIQTFILYVSTTSATARTLAARLYNSVLDVEVITNSDDVQDHLGNGVGGRFNSAVTLRPYRLNLPIEAYKKEEVDITSAVFNNYISCAWRSTVIDFKSLTLAGDVNWSISRHSGKFSYWEWGFTVCGQPGYTYAGRNLQPYQKRGDANQWRELAPYVPASISRPIAGQAIIAERLGTDHWQFCWARDGSSSEYVSKSLVLTDVYGNVHRLRAHFDRTFQFLNIALY